MEKHIWRCRSESCPESAWHNLQIYIGNCLLHNCAGKNKSCVSLGITFPCEKATSWHTVPATIPKWESCSDVRRSFHSLQQRHVKIFLKRGHQRRSELLPPLRVYVCGLLLLALQFPGLEVRGWSLGTGMFMYAAPVSTNIRSTASCSHGGILRACLLGLGGGANLSKCFHLKMWWFHTLFDYIAECLHERSRANPDFFFSLSQNWSCSFSIEIFFHSSATIFFPFRERAGANTQQTLAEGGVHPGPVSGPLQGWDREDLNLNMDFFLTFSSRVKPSF